jgi:hypothetical protein
LIIFLVRSKIYANTPSQKGSPPNLSSPT